MHIADGGASTIMWRSIKPIPSKPESAWEADIKGNVNLNQLRKLAQKVM